MVLIEVINQLRTFYHCKLEEYPGADEGWNKAVSSTDGWLVRRVSIQGEGAQHGLKLGNEFRQCLPVAMRHQLARVGFQYLNGQLGNFDEELELILEFLRIFRGDGHVCEIGENVIIFLLPAQLILHEFNRVTNHDFEVVPLAFIQIGSASLFHMLTASF